MRKSISEMAKLSGVSVRTLHYYDEIGLLKPSEIIPETGYRYYDENSMETLQQILFYRELDFPLKDIEVIMNASEYNKEDALLKQRELLMLKRRRLDKLIRLLSANLKGDTSVKDEPFTRRFVPARGSTQSLLCAKSRAEMEITMSFKEFDMNEINDAKEKYVAEVKEKWGSTKAYEQSQNRTGGYSKEDWKKVSEGMDELLKKFAAKVGNNPGCEEVQKLVAEWKQYITDTYYDCTNEILAGLGQMYVEDERFKKNMDRFGSGTAQLICDAISVYCK